MRAWNKARGCECIPSFKRCVGQKRLDNQQSTTVYTDLNLDQIQTLRGPPIPTILIPLYPFRTAVRSLHNPSWWSRMLVSPRPPESRHTSPPWHRLGGIAVPLVLLILAAGPAAAQDHQEDAHGDEHFHKNHVAAMAGGMTPLSAKSATSFALGADYVRRLNPTWGIGIGADFTFGDHKRSSLFVAGATFNPVPSLRLGTGPGFELVDKDMPGGGTSTKAYFVWFVSAIYEFHVGSLSIGPLVALDFVGETKTNLTYGLSVGTGF